MIVRSELVETEPAFASSPTTPSACREGMMESGTCTSVEQQIEHSKSHWSQLVDFDSDEEGVVAEIDNVEVFKTLQSHPQWGHYFKTLGYDTDVCLSAGSLEVGSKFAEGGQAELFHAKVTWNDPETNKDEFRWGIDQAELFHAKVFKKGTFLRHLQSSCPPRTSEEL